MTEILDRCQATDQFKEEVRAFAEHRPVQRIATSRPAPRVKVVRVLTQLMHAEPGLQVDRVVIDAWSGCSDFRGTLVVDANGERRVFDFVWDCHWRAVEEGWTDAFGLPDQIRAAREFGWRCFERWSERKPSAVASA
jgi:hypothetical protein